MENKSMDQPNSFYQPIEKNRFSFILSLSDKTEHKFLQIFLFCQIRSLLIDLFHDSIQHQNEKNFYLPMERYMMDNKIVQIIIREIIETGEYTLEGIAYQTRIPLDVIVDAMCDKNHLSITFWASVIELYIQVKPEVCRMIADKLESLKLKFINF